MNVQVNQRIEDLNLILSTLRIIETVYHTAEHSVEGESAGSVMRTIHAVD